MKQRVMRASELAGLPVVTIDAGDDIAEIKDVVYDGNAHRLIGFTLNKRGWFRGALKEQLPAEAIAAIGTHAIMILSSADVEDTGAADPVVNSDNETHEVLNNEVLTADGKNLGTIVGVILSTGETPAAVGYEVQDQAGVNSFIPISAQMSLSGTNLLVPAESTAFIRDDLAGFGAAVDDHRAALDRAATALGAQS